MSERAPERGERHIPSGVQPKEVKSRGVSGIMKWVASGVGSAGAFFAGERLAKSLDCRDISSMAGASFQRLPDHVNRNLGGAYGLTFPHFTHDNQLCWGEGDAEGVGIDVLCAPVTETADGTDFQVGMSAPVALPATFDGVSDLIFDTEDGNIFVRNVGDGWLYRQKPGEMPNQYTGGIGGGGSISPRFQSGFYTEIGIDASMYEIPDDLEPPDIPQRDPRVIGAQVFARPGYRYTGIAEGSTFALVDEGPNQVCYDAIGLDAEENNTYDGAMTSVPWGADYGRCTVRLFPRFVAWVCMRAAELYKSVVPTPLDSDMDGIPDDVDNCDFDRNRAQLDVNGNGIGAACDLCDDPVGHPENCEAVALGFRERVRGVFLDGETSVVDIGGGQFDVHMSGSGRTLITREAATQGFRQLESQNPDPMRFQWNPLVVQVDEGLARIRFDDGSERLLGVADGEVAFVEVPGFIAGHEGTQSLFRGTLVERPGPVDGGVGDAGAEGGADAGAGDGGGADAGAEGGAGDGGDAVDAGAGEAGHADGGREDGAVEAGGNDGGDSDVHADDVPDAGRADVRSDANDADAEDGTENDPDANGERDSQVAEHDHDAGRPGNGNGGCGKCTVALPHTPQNIANDAAMLAMLALATVGLERRANRRRKERG